MTNTSVMNIDLLQPETLKVLVEPPVSNSFIWGSDTPGSNHLVHHRLSTIYLGAQFWVKNASGVWHQEIVGATILDPGRLNITLPEQRDVRVILSPVALEGPNWEQGLHNRLTQLETKYDGLQNSLEQLRNDITDGTVGGGSLGEHHIYLETTPKTLHRVVHNLDSTFVSVAAWVMIDGVWYQQFLTHEPVSKNELVIETTQPVALRVRVRGEDL